MGKVKHSESSYAPILRQCFLTASVATNVVGHGCAIAFAAILIPNLRKPESHIHATHSEESWIASIIGFAMIFGNIINTIILDAAGRKICHFLTTLPILASWFIVLLVKNVAGLIIARFLQGVSMGMLGPLGCIIIGEMTDPKFRGMFLTSISLSLTIGVLFCHTLGTYFTWQQCSLISSFTTFTSLVIIIYTPESPSWLISKGRYEEATEVFFWLRGNGVQQETELEKMIEAQKMARKSSIAGQNVSLATKIKRSFRRFNASCRLPEFYKPILIMIFLYVMFQFAGINVITSYTTDIIEQMLGPEADAKLLMVLLDIERLVCNILAVYLMKTLNRRTLLFTSGSICVLSYFGKAGYLYLRQSGYLPFDSQWIPIGLIGIYMFSLTIGISSIPVTIGGEIFPLEYRGLGGGISVLALSVGFFAAVKSFRVLNVAIGLALTYFLYASIVMVLLIFIWFILPETKDRTLQDIEDHFRGTHLGDVKSVEPLNGVESEMRRCSSHILY